MRTILLISLLFFLSYCSNKSEQKFTNYENLKPVVSLMGDSLPISDMRGSKQEDAYLQALEKWKTKPSEENYIWLGRRRAYMQHYHESIDIFTEGIKAFPQSYRLYRHRGHRYISVRQFDLAIADFEKAAQLVKGRELEIEEDGLPNKLNIPLSNTQFNIYYHWALAHYLKAEFDRAIELYEICLQWSVNDDLKVATTDWLYMSLKRAGQNDKAALLLASIPDELEIIENDSYYKRIDMYRAKLEPSSLLNPDEDAEDYDLSLATQGYGVGNFYLYNGNEAKAKEVFEKIIDGKHWAAFGYIAAEAELNRLR